MNPVRVLFAVPVYREPEGEYYARLDAEDERRLATKVRTMENFLADHSRPSEIAADFANSTPHGQGRIPWRYNRIVGWVEFYSDRKTIKADLWLAKRKTVPRNFKNITIQYRGKIGEVCLSHSATNSEIRAALAAFIDACENGAYSWNRKRKYTLDKVPLLRQLSFIDLLGLIAQIERDMHHE